MTPPRSMRALCHAVVALWIAAWLALPSASLLGEPAAEPAEEERTRLAPVALEPPAPPEPPQPEPSEPPRLVDTPVRVRDLERGDGLLDAAGRFPALSCSYEGLASFGDYARAMQRLGARFVAVRERRIVGAVDVVSGRVVAASVEGSFSPRARDYTGEPGLQRASDAVRTRFGSGTTVMMLVPRDLDAGLFGAIARTLEERGEEHASFREIAGRYTSGPDGQLQLRIEEAVRRDGARVELDLRFDLGQIARLAAGRAA